jgi:L-histidine N-alpha-methyltransferase
MSSAVTTLERARESAAARRARVLRDVREGLARTPKDLPSKYFYDARGSDLFEEITRLPEYYLTRTERLILTTQVPALIAELRPRTLVELGAGSAVKTRIILDAMRAAGSLEEYTPVDVSEEFLTETASRIHEEYSGLRVIPTVADISAELALPRASRHPALVAFLGSTIGNFDETSAVSLLSRVRDALGPFDRLLVGADLRKEPETIERAYNDAAGVTAAFNRNVLHVLNTELGADFRPDEFAHRAFYDRSLHRIEMQLVARSDQRVHIDGMPEVTVRESEAIRTEISCKYDRATIEDLFARAGLALERWMTDPQGAFAMAVGVRSI